jgi:hypothetical protein
MTLQQLLAPGALEQGTASERLLRQDGAPLTRLHQKSDIA